MSIQQRGSGQYQVGFMLPECDSHQPLPGTCFFAERMRNRFVRACHQISRGWINLAVCLATALHTSREESTSEKIINQLSPSISSTVHNHFFTASQQGSYESPRLCIERVPVPGRLDYPAPQPPGGGRPSCVQGPDCKATPDHH